MAPKAGIGSPYSSVPPRHRNSKYFIEERNDICLFKRKSQFIILHFPELKQLIDEAQHTLRTLIHCFQRMYQLTRNISDTLYFFQSPVN